MPVTTLLPEIVNASKASALLVDQVRRDLEATSAGKNTNGSELTIAAAMIAAAIIGTLDDASAIHRRLGR